MPDPVETKPILVSPKRAMALIDVGPHVYDRLVRDGTIKTRLVGRRRRVIFSSLEAMGRLEQAAA